jgi:hypothetical protein
MLIVPFSVLCGHVKKKKKKKMLIAENESECGYNYKVYVTHFQLTFNTLYYVTNDAFQLFWMPSLNLIDLRLDLLTSNLPHLQV